MRNKAAQTISARRAKMLDRLATEVASKRRKETQTKLLDAGRKLIVEKGVGATSVGDICKKAGFTRGAFYSNFSDMPSFLVDLTRGLWRYIVQTLLARIGEPQEELPDEIEEVNRLLAEKLGQWIERQPKRQQTLGQIAGQIVEALPDDQESYLLMQELRGYALRYPTPAKPIRSLLKEIAQTVEAIIDSVLTANNAYSKIGTRALRKLLINWGYSEVFDNALYDDANGHDLSSVAEALIKLNDEPKDGN